MICLELEYLKLNHPGLAACGVTEEATWAISGVHEEPVWGGVTAEGATLKEDVRNIKKHVLVSFTALGVIKSNAHYCSSFLSIFFKFQ